MANSYNSNPVLIDTDMTQGWKASQTLYASAKAAVFGRVNKIILQANGATTSGAVVITDPIDNTILWQAGVNSSTGPNDFELLSNPFTHAVSWRDFKAVGLTATNTKLLIWSNA